jgi:hypothetical protein
LVNVNTAEIGLGSIALSQCAGLAYVGPEERVAGLCGQRI